jgi:tetratricopeptide (TPR) repeat protein
LLLPHERIQAGARTHAGRPRVLAVAPQKGHCEHTSSSQREFRVPLIGALPVTSTSRFRGLAAGTAVAAFSAACLVAMPVLAAAQGGQPVSSNTIDLSSFSASGSYLAARHAGQQRDALAAATYYRAALRRDPKNAELLDRAFVSLLVGGDIGEAVKFAERAAQTNKSDRVARLVLGVNDLKIGHFATARRNLGQSVHGPITDLTATLLSAWSLAGAGDTKGAVAAIDRLTGPDWYGIFKDLHAGLILDYAGQKQEAGKRFERAYKQDSSALRVVEAYGGWLSRNRSAKEALDVYAAFDKVLSRHPLVVEAMTRLKGAAEGAAPAADMKTPELKLAPGVVLMRGKSGPEVVALQTRLGLTADGRFGPLTFGAVRDFQTRGGLAADGIVGVKTLAKLNESEAPAQTATPAKEDGAIPMMVSSVQAGAAEALYGLGASLGRRGGEDLGLVYLQLALHLSPKHELALLSLSDLYEAMKKPDMAIKIYERIPQGSVLYRNAAIQWAANLDALEKGAEAQKRLEDILKTEPNDLEATLALGNLQRGHKKFAECADTYSKAIDLIGKPEKANWTVFYFRGICFERAKQWTRAEADLKKALELFPDQAHVLNYLGYSWIDQGVNLDEGMAMIKKAVAQRPDDGYIVDSLGWAYYRIGNYEEATRELERAIGLKPEDPTINDHLGDAYWRVGRRLEATFQWNHARDLKPDPDELPKILEKLRSGLPDETTSQANSTEKPAAKPGNGG